MARRESVRLSVAGIAAISISRDSHAMPASAKRSGSTLPSEHHTSAPCCRWRGQRCSIGARTKRRGVEGLERRRADEPAYPRAGVALE